MGVPYTEEALQILAKNITYNYKGKAISDVLTSDIIDDFNTDIEAMNALAGNIIPNFMRTFSDMLNVNLYMDGLSNIFDIPEYMDLDRARSFISLFDKRDKLMQKLMDRGDGMIVTIGAENADDDMKDCSLITATYHVDGHMVGKIGVIGPTRMKYGEITSIVEYLTDNLSNTFMLRGGEENDDG
jgi:heat-inducible transcriptional repressor